MSARDVAVKKNRYFDSVFLMAVARRLSDQPGIDKAAAVMGSPANKAILLEMGFAEEALEAAGPNDLVVAFQGDKDAIRALTENIEEWLVRPKTELAGTIAISFDDALSRQPNSNLAVISVPGEYAAREAHAALDHGMNVFLFSDHVALKDEVALKQKASDVGLIVMGPDCGTALIGGAGIGFANVVRRGPIGIVAASGTGLQEFTCLVHRSGSGISHGFGTGSRDLSNEVAGLSALTAIDALEEDPETAVIAVISKPPGESTLRIITERLSKCTKPVVACFLGLNSDSLGGNGKLEICSTIHEAVDAALRSVAGNGLETLTESSNQINTLAKSEAERMATDQVYVRGLFAGGTFCYQAQQVMRDGGIAVASNASLEGMLDIEDPKMSIGNTLIDMGADEFTVGVPHPMIDATNRRERILVEAEDPRVAVLLLDFILGFNASPDPAGDLVEAITVAKSRATEAGRYLSVVASICGTEEDPQGLAQQAQALRDAGVVVFASSARASQFARDILRKRMGVFS